MAHDTPKFQSGSKEAANNKAMDAAELWMHDLVKWCQQVHRDILRLEASAHLPPGDPGPPPDSPWE